MPEEPRLPSRIHRVSVAPTALDGVELVEATSDRAFPRHSHDQFGIGWMAAGAHRSWSGRGPVEAGPGDVIAVNPEELHDGLPVRGEPRSWCMAFVAPHALERLTGDGAGGRELVRPVASDPALARAVRSAYGLLREGSRVRAGEALALLFADRLETADAEARAPGAPSAPVRRILERLHDAAGEPASLDELAALAGMSRTGALRRFRREVGATPGAYALQLRVRRARALLAGGTGLADAAAAAGFADQSHLTRAFGRQFGLPPGRWRSALRAGNPVQDAPT